MHHLFLATEQGFIAFEKPNQSWRETARGLQGKHVTSLIAREGVILAGTTNGVYRSDDLGQTWQAASEGLTIPHIRWLAYHPAISDAEFAGTEPAGIFVSRDGGATWRECPGVAALRDQHGWFLPYSDGAGCVRGFAFHGSRAYAAVEVGGVLRSDDGGDTWALAGGSSGEPTLETPSAPWLPADVHSVAVHAALPDVVYAATHSGLYCSGDGGACWMALYPNCYTRALWLDPTDPQHILFSPASPRGWHGRIEETRDGGQTWTVLAPEQDLILANEMVERFAPVGDELLAVLSNGHLLAAPLATLQWRPLLVEQETVTAVTSMGAA